MSNLKLYYGNDLLDYSDKVDVKYNSFDIKDPDIGYSVKSYSIIIPLTGKNRKLLGVPDVISNKKAIDGTFRLLIGETLLIKGKLRIFKIVRENIEGSIEANEWVADLGNTSIRSLAWAGGDDHTFSSANVVNSWSAAAGALYRYPLVNFGKLWSEMVGSSSEVWPWDFVPMWNVWEIVKKIFYFLEHSLDSGNFFGTTEGKKLYIMGPEPLNEQSFADNNEFEANVTAYTDNHVTDTHPASISYALDFPISLVKFETEITDEPSKYEELASKFTCPKTGTYRFRTEFKVYCSHNQELDYSSVTEQYQVIIYNENQDVNIAVTSGSGGADFFDDNFKIKADSGYVKCIKDDVIYVKFIARSVATNNLASPRTIDLYIEEGSTCFFKNIHDERNLYKGLGDTISPTTYLPDITCLDFLKALRHLYGIRIWVDQLRRKVYIFPNDEFVGTEVVDLTSYLDMSEKVEQEVIAYNYKKIQNLQYKDDPDDRALQDHVLDNGVLPYRKQLILSNINAQDGIEVVDNKIFAPTVTKWPGTAMIGEYIATIYDDYIYPNYYPNIRLNTFVPRLFKWDGLTAKSWWYNSNVLDTPSNEANYPKVSCPDIATLFSSYYQKHWHYIDNSKLITATIVIDINKLSQLITVLTDGSKEGFRAVYKLQIDGVYMYFILNSVITDGKRAKCEFIQKI